jgi:hypothetical protein
MNDALAISRHCSSMCVSFVLSGKEKWWTVAAATTVPGESLGRSLLRTTVYVGSYPCYASEVLGNAAQLRVATPSGCASALPILRQSGTLRTRRRHHHPHKAMRRCRAILGYQMHSCMLSIWIKPEPCLNWSCTMLSALRRHQHQLGFGPSLRQSLV